MRVWLVNTVHNIATDRPYVKVLKFGLWTRIVHGVILLQRLDLNQRSTKRLGEVILNAMLELAEYSRPAV